MKNKLIIDSISLLSPMTGIGRYTYEISKKIKDSDIYDLSFYYGYHSKNLLEANKDYKTKQLKSILSKNPLIKKVSRKIFTKYNALNNLRKFDLYWQPNFIPNLNIRAKQIVTSVHDFSFVHYKDYHPKERIEYFENNFSKNIKSSNFIVTGSEYTKNEILERIHINEKNLKVIYHGINHDIFYKKEVLTNNLDLPEKFLLCVGSLEPRKNLIRLIKAYILLPKEIKEEYNLILVGHSGWENSEIVNLLKENQQYVRYTGYISDEELSLVYNLATIFIYPSVYEGFGLPPVEAMACGTPVITSLNTSMEEICKDYVTYVDPFEIDDIKYKIEYLIKNEEIRINNSQKALIHAKEFTWEKSTESHVNLFNSLF